MADIMLRFWICCFILNKQTNIVIVLIMFQYIISHLRVEAQRTQITFSMSHSQKEAELPF